MEIIKQYLKSKTLNEEDCEDSIFVSDDFAAVIDGATSKSHRKYKGMMSGKFISKLVCQAINSLPIEFSAEKAINFLSNSVLSFYNEYGIVKELENNPVERASASVIIFSKFKNEIWMLGDCQCIVDGKRYTNNRYIDELLSNVRSFYLQTEFKKNKHLNFHEGIDPGREFILPLLERQSLLENSSVKSEFTFGVIDGFKVPRKEIKVIKLSNPKIIILASDGYPKLYSNFLKSETYLQKIIDEDPLCYKNFKSTKGLSKGNISFDDRAYLKIKVS